MADKVLFETNKPLEVALRYLDGKEVESRFGPPQIMFTTIDGRAMFLPQFVAERVHSLGLEVGEPFEIGRMEVNKGGRKAVEWSAKRIYPRSEAAASVETMKPASVGRAVEGHRSNPQSQHTNGSMENGNGAANGASRNFAGAVQVAVDRLVGESIVLIDGFAAALDYASKRYGNAMRPEDIRSLVLSAYIQSGKGGR